MPIEENKGLRSFSEESIVKRIYSMRGYQVMLDSDLAELYEVPTKRLNEQVKRNKERFPEDFMFQLKKEEMELLKSQNATAKHEWGGRRTHAYVFTEQGVASLSSVLKSKKAIEVHVNIMRAFVAMRKFVSIHADLFRRVDIVEKKQLMYEMKIQSQFEEIFELIEKKKIVKKQGIFFEGQIFDAYTFVSELICSAQKSILIIDNYVDESVLTLLTKRKPQVQATIYTKNMTKQLELDLAKCNSQYEPIKIQKFEKSHDRFIIIDNHDIYRLGASLKDLGKKWFAFSKMGKEGIKILQKIPD